MRVLMTGGTGYLGTAMQERVPAGVEVISAGHNRGRLRLDVTNEASVHEAVTGSGVAAIIHLAAVSRVEAVAADPAAADVNVVGSAAVARVAEQTGTRLVALSSDVVFGGTAAPYDEQAVPDPINEYGQSKAAAERAIERANPGALVIRTSVLVGRDRADRFPFSCYVIERARAGEQIELFHNERRNFYPVTMAASTIWDCLLSPLSGTIHVATLSSLSRFEFGVRLLEQARLDPTLAVAATGPANRPSDLTLDVRLAAQSLPSSLPTMDEAITETLADLGLP